jgi:hypothetical protein
MMAADEVGDEQPDDEEAEIEVDMDLLKRRILSLKAGMSVDHDANLSLENANTPTQIYVLIFNEGSLNEGIYSLRIGSEEKTDVVVGWEIEEDAREYGECLEEQNMPTPTPKAYHVAQVQSFCQDSGHLLGVVRQGVKVTPPTRTVERFDWSPDGSNGEPPQREADGTYTEDQLDSLRLRLERATRLGPLADRDKDGEGEQGSEASV